MSVYFGREGNREKQYTVALTSSDTVGIRSEQWDIRQSILLT